MLLYGFGLLVNVQARQKAQYAHAANTDALTGLPNRRLLWSQLERELGRSSRYGSTFSVALLDLDYFKDINDSYGHGVGDAVLSEFARLLSEQLRKPDSAGRWGGEEFLLLFPELPCERALVVSERFRKTLATHPFPHGRTLTASLGVAEVIPGERLEALLARADRALYDAKARGRNRVALCTALEWEASVA